MSFKNNKEFKFDCERSPNYGNYAGVYFFSGKECVLELRISGQAIINGPCGLEDEDIHEWLCQTGRKFVDEIKEKQILLITADQVIDKELIVDWTKLRKN